MHDHAAPLRTLSDAESLLASTTSAIDALNRRCVELDLSGVLDALADAVIALEAVYPADTASLARENAADWRAEDRRTEAV